MADVAAKDGSQVSPFTHQSCSCVHSDVHGKNLSFFADSGDTGEPCCVVSWASADPSSGRMDRVCPSTNRFAPVARLLRPSPSIPPPLSLNPSSLLLSRMIWLLFICFTTFHLVANHRAVSVVAMETLNKNRLHLVMAHYLSAGAVLPVKSVNAREPILSSKHWPPFTVFEKFVHNIRSGSTRVLSYDLGCPLSRVLTK